MTRALHIVSKSKQRLTFLGALVVVAVTATAASAYFTATGAGTVTASTGTLTAPRNPSASAGGAHVTVELDAALLSNGTPAQSYTVERYTGTGSDDGPACGGATVASSAGVPNASGHFTCTDTPTTSDTFKYKIAAKYHSWTATSRFTNAVSFSVDTTPPTSSTTFPGAGAYNTSGYNTGCSTPSTGDVCGTASDNAGGSGLSNVQVSIQRLSDSTYWSGLTWVNGVTWNDAAGTTSWNYAFDTINLTDGVSYTIHSRATDNATNVETTADSKTFTYDSTAPTTAIAVSPSTPNGSDGWYRALAPTVALSASDAGGSGVASTLYTIDSGTTQTYASAATVPEGQHTISYWSTDKAGNTGTTNSSPTIKVDLSNPTGGSIIANGGNTFNPTGTVALSKTDFTDAVSGIASNGLTRASATLTGNSCGTLSGSTSVTITGGNDSAALTTCCYQYTLTGTDNAANNTTAQSAVIKVDRTSPTFAITSTGPAVSTNGTNTVFFKNGGTGSFTITASDPDSGLGSTSFPNAPSGWAKSTGTNSATYTLNGATTGTSLSGVSATNAAGGTTNLSVTITLDNTAPTNSLSLGSSPIGAFLNGTTLYFKNNANGSFTLVNTVSDSGGSGPASATFPLVSATNWTHSPATVTAPAGGPYSSAYSWTSGAATPTSPQNNLTSTDLVGNTGAATTLTFTPDTTNATAAVALPNASIYGPNTWTGSITGTATDAGSGIGAVLVSVKDTTSGKCADATGAFMVSSCTTNFVAATGTTSWSFAEAAANLTGGDSYNVTVETIDNVGNTNANAASAAWTYDATTPTPVSVVATDGGSQNVLGKIDAGNKSDTLSFTYSEAINASSVTTGTVTVTFTDGGASNNDTITVPGIGTVDLGSKTWLSATSTKSESLVRTSTTVYTLSITTDPAGNTTGNAASNFTWSTSGGTATDVAGNGATGPVTTTLQRF